VIRVPKLIPSKTTFLVGAGGSREAGLPTANEFVAGLFGAVIQDRRVRRELLSAFSPERSTARYGGDYLRFETVLGVVREVVDPGLSVLQVFAATTLPGPLQTALAAAAMDRAKLVSPNFDDLLEQGLKFLGARARTLDAFSPRQRPGGACEVEVLKLHGSLWRHSATRRRRSTGRLLATIEAIASHSPGFQMPEPALSRLREATEGRVLVVVGYSAGDDLDIVPSLIHLKPSRVIWIQHAEGQPPWLVPLPRGRTKLSARDSVLLAHAHARPVHLISGETRQVLKELGLKDAATPPGTDRDWHAVLDEWAYAHRRDLGNGDPLAACLLSDLERYETAYKVGRRANGRAGLAGTSPWTPGGRASRLAEWAFLSNAIDESVVSREARRAVQLGRVEKDPNAEGYGLLTVARLYAQRDEDQRAIQAYEAALRLAGDSNARHQVAVSLAFLLHTLQRDDEALELLGESLPALQRTGLLSETVDGLQRCGVIRRERGEFAAARDDFAQAAELATQLPTGQQAFAALAMQGAVERELGHLDAAEALLLQALAIADAAPVLRFEHAIAYSFLTRVLIDQGDLDAASKAAGQALALLRENAKSQSARSARAIIRLHRAELQLLRGRRPAALRIIREMRAKVAHLPGEPQRKLRVLEYICGVRCDASELREVLSASRQRAVPEYLEHRSSLVAAGKWESLAVSEP
jgi:tetratricopeptide (TPR) repeat protein